MQGTTLGVSKLMSTNMAADTYC